MIKLTGLKFGKEIVFRSEIGDERVTRGVVVAVDVAVVRSFRSKSLNSNKTESSSIESNW
jgi:hypothetical protein